MLLILMVTVILMVLMYVMMLMVAMYNADIDTFVVVDGYGGVDGGVVKFDI